MRWFEFCFCRAVLLALLLAVTGCGGVVTGGASERELAIEDMPGSSTLPTLIATEGFIARSNLPRFCTGNEGPILYPEFAGLRETLERVRRVIDPVLTRVMLPVLDLLTLDQRNRVRVPVPLCFEPFTGSPYWSIARTDAEPATHVEVRFDPTTFSIRVRLPADTLEEVTVSEVEVARAAAHFVVRSLLPMTTMERMTTEFEYDVRLRLMRGVEEGVGDFLAAAVLRDGAFATLLGEGEGARLDVVRAVEATLFESLEGGARQHPAMVEVADVRLMSVPLASALWQAYVVAEGDLVVVGPDDVGYLRGDGRGVAVAAVRATEAMYWGVTPAHTLVNVLAALGSEAVYPKGAGAGGRKLLCASLQRAFAAHAARGALCRDGA